MYRTQLSIIADILNTVLDCSSEGANITLLIRRGNISYNRIKKILNRLVSNGLIQEVHGEGANRYMISEKGIEFLRAYSKFHDFAESFGLSI